MDLLAIPDWLGTAVTGTVAAVIGFLAKAEIDRRRQLRARESELRERLKRLASLLHHSASVFTDQNKLVRRLSSQLAERLGSALDTGRGFDEDFFVAYELFTTDDRELHSIIRGITMNSLRSVNDQLSQWLSGDTDFKTYVGADAHRAELKLFLQRLERHLSRWHDKYMSILVEDSKRSLVYLGDEKEQGEPFPTGIEQVVERSIARNDA